jgi:hypothetical protein
MRDASLDNGFNGLIDIKFAKRYKEFIREHFNIVYLNIPNFNLVLARAWQDILDDPRTSSIIQMQYS